MATISITLTPEQAEELKDCEVGEKLTGSVTKNDDTGMEIEIEKPEYKEDGTEETAADGEAKPKSKGMRMILGDE